MSNLDCLLRLSPEIDPFLSFLLVFVTSVAMRLLRRVL